MDSVICPQCACEMEALPCDQVRCPNKECAVVVLPMAQIRATRHRDELFAKGMLRNQQPVGAGECLDSQTVAAFVAAGNGPKIWK